MGDSLDLRINDHLLSVHCSHSSIDFLLINRHCHGSLSIPWGLWEEVQKIATPENTGEELFIGDLSKSYLSLTPMEPCLNMEAKGLQHGLFVELFIPWDIWQSVVQWLNGPGKQSVDKHPPGILRKDEKFTIKKIGVSKSRLAG